MIRLQSKLKLVEVKLYRSQLKVFICTIKLKQKIITEEQLDKALQLAVKNCTIVQSVKDSIKVTETIELLMKHKKRENTALTFLCFNKDLWCDVK